jgi:hypothetical protein
MKKAHQIVFPIDIHEKHLKREKQTLGYPVHKTFLPYFMRPQVREEE